MCTHSTQGPGGCFCRISCRDIMHRPLRRHQAVPRGCFSIWRQVFWQKRHTMRLKQPRSLMRCHGASGEPPERSLLRSCHITCRACKRCDKQGSFPPKRIILTYISATRIASKWRLRSLSMAGKNAHCCRQKTRHIMRGMFPFFRSGFQQSKG